MFLPKHVESCFLSGQARPYVLELLHAQPRAERGVLRLPQLQAATHTVYANMPYPAYQSATGYTCSTDKDFAGVVQAPNGNPDADTEMSPTSHEISEAITDPDVATGWFDSSGYENGDECAYVYGATAGNGRRGLQPDHQRPPLSDPGGVQQPRLHAHRWWLPPERVTN